MSKPPPPPPAVLADLLGLYACRFGHRYRAAWGKVQGGVPGFTFARLTPAPYYLHTDPAELRRQIAFGTFTPTK